MNNTKEKTVVAPSPFLKGMRALSVVLLLCAIGYIVMPWDYDKRGVMGYVDDFFIFMGAFSFLNGAFQGPERHYIRRQLWMIALVFAVLGLLWVYVLGVM